MAIGSNPCGCPGGITNCEEAYDCITTHICDNRGLRVDDAAGCFGVALGSCLGFDAQGRVAYICGDQPQPGPCHVTYDSVLASGDFIVGGRLGGSGGLLSWGSPQGIDYAVTHGVQLIEVYTFQLDDGIATWSPQRRSWPLQELSNSLADDAWSRESQTWMATTGTPGTMDNYTGNRAIAPPNRKTPDGGYFGYKMPQFPLMTAVQGLRQVDSRALVTFQTWNYTGGVRVEDVQAIVEAIGTACAQQWTMVTVPHDEVDYIPIITDAGIPAGVDVDTEDAITPQEVIDTGATWVRLNSYFSDAYISGFVDAGLEVLVATNSRQFETEHMQTLGATGIVCDQPVYAADDFRGTHSQSWAGRGKALGTLDYRTDQQNITRVSHYTNGTISGLFIWNNQGVAEEYAGDNFGALFQNVLIGVLRPDDVETEWPGGTYTLDITLRPYWDTMPQRDGSRMGVAFGANFDTDLSGRIDGLYGSRYRDIRSGYFFWTDVENAQGTMRLERLGPSGITPLALNTPATGLTQGDYWEYSLTVTPTTIRVDRSDGEFVEATDDTYRGKWMYAVTQFAHDGTNTDDWESVFRLFPNW